MPDSPIVGARHARRIILSLIGATLLAGVTLQQSCAKGCDLHTDCAEGTYCSDDKFCERDCRADVDCTLECACDVARGRCLRRLTGDHCAPATGASPADGGSDAGEPASDAGEDAGAGAQSRSQATSEVRGGY